MNIGIVGSGMIVNDCLEALSGLDNVSCNAICVREHSIDKGQKLSQKYHISTIYTDYEAFLQDPSFDFVYLGIVNSEHYNYAKKALLLGRNVILEKPFTLTKKEAEELVLLAEEKHIFLWEAITTPYFPNFELVQKKLPQIGEVKLVQCNFSQRSSRYDRYLAGEIAPAFDPVLGGGALNDLNVYNIHFVSALFGMPKQVTYHPNIGHNGIDTSGAIVMEYPKFTALCTAAKDSESPHFALIQGTDGYICVNGQVSICPDVDIFLEKEIKVYQENTFVHRMQHEFDFFASCFEKRDYAKCYEMLEQTLRVMNILEEAIK